MAIKVPTINASGELEGAGLDAVKRMNYGKTYNICSPEFGADPTGEKDSTQAIQKAVNKASEGNGGGVVVIPGGEFRVSPPFIELKGYVTIRGEGIGSSRLIMDASKVSEGTTETGVFHTGSYNERVHDRNRFRISLNDFSIHATQKDGKVLRGDNGEYRHIPAEEFQDKAWGLLFNTYLGEGPADPDAVHTISDIEIWDMAGGLALLGLDDQGCKISNIRVRRTWKQGLLVGKPFDHPEAYETNPTNSAKPYRRTGAADNKFFRMDISGANNAGAGYAGIEVYTSQSMFAHCTSWYHRRSYAGDSAQKLSGDTENIWNLSATTQNAIVGKVNTKTDKFRYTKDGAGWYIAGTRNEFSNCTSQETGGHGWILIGALCTYTDCRGESPSYSDTAKYGSAKPSEAAGFLITNWAWGNRLAGCIVQNAYKRESAAKVGFYIQDYAKQLRVRDCVTTNMPYANGRDSSEGENAVELPPHPGEEFVVEVNEKRTSTFSYHQEGGASSERQLVAPLTPAEISNIVVHWDFSNASTVTSQKNRVSAVKAIDGSAKNGELVQPVEDKQPYLSWLNSLPAIKVKSSDSLFLQAPDIGTYTATDGWSIVVLASELSKANGQYLWSSVGAGAKSPASITVTEMLGVRANSGGSSRGYTAKSADKALSLYSPDVIVMTATSAGIEVYINGEKSSEKPVATQPVSDLVGKATVGAYYGGTNGADAIIGEVVAFSKALSEEEVSGLSAYLKNKWG